MLPSYSSEWFGNCQKKVFWEKHLKRNNRWIWFEAAFVPCSTTNNFKNFISLNTYATRDVYKNAVFAFNCTLLIPEIRKYIKKRQKNEILFAIKPCFCEKPMSIKLNNKKLLEISVHSLVNILNLYIVTFYKSSLNFPATMKKFSHLHKDKAFVFEEIPPCGFYFSTYFFWADDQYEQTTCICSTCRKETEKAADLWFGKGWDTGKTIGTLT